MSSREDRALDQVFQSRMRASLEMLRTFDRVHGDPGDRAVAALHKAIELRERILRDQESRDPLPWGRDRGRSQGRVLPETDLLWRGQPVYALGLSGTGLRGGGTYDQSRLATLVHACVESEGSESGFRAVCGKVKPKNILGDLDPSAKMGPITCPACLAKWHR